MKESTVQTLVALETAQPAKKLNRSAGAIYFALIMLVLAAITTANFLFLHWQIPRIYVQLGLYALFAAVGFYIYRNHYVCFRYTLTNQAFAVERIAGSKERSLAAISLSDIESVSPYNSMRVAAKTTLYASVWRKRNSIQMVARFEERKTILYFSPSKDFLDSLQAQLRIAARREST